MFIISGSQDFPYLRQWQVTFSIINMGSFLVQLIYVTSSADVQGWTITLTITLAAALILFAVTKDYIEKYVRSSKI